MRMTRSGLPARTRSDNWTGGAEGFSLIELLTTLAIIGIICGMSYMAFANILPGLRADSAMQVLMIQLRQAREASVDQRRNVTVTFQGTAELVTVRQNLPNGTTTLSDYILPYGMVFNVFGGVPDVPAPDNNGNGQSVNFPNCAGLPCTITFQSDGSVVDGNGNPINGTVFIGKNGGQNSTARAVALLGSTGKMKGYRYNGAVWH